MKPTTLIRRSVLYYWRTNLAVVAGVAVAVSVLAGALLVGQSVRTSLREIALSRLGNTGSVVAAASFFREGLADSFESAAPLISLTGVARHQPTGRLASEVGIYGVDERFFEFHGISRDAPAGRKAYLSPALARELEAEPDEGILLRIEEQSYVPAESLHGKKEDAGKTVRLSMAGVLAADEMGEFSLRTNQGPVLAIFVPLDRLQRELLREGRVNTLILGPDEADAESKLRSGFVLDDLGIRVRTLPDGRTLQAESRSGILSDDLAGRMENLLSGLDLKPNGIFTYLANSIRVGDRDVPYSLVAAVPMTESGDQALPPIVLNRWAADELRARPGDNVVLDYYLWTEDNRLETASAEFQLAGIRPVVRDPDYSPEYPGITDSDDVTDWDPPFPLDLNRVRPQDEAYWDRYRTTPKAFVPLAAGQKLWQSQYGKLTAIRAELPADADPAATADEFRTRLRASLDPFNHGFRIAAVREQSLEGSRGATDFGEYFFYFSFFLVVSALLLAGLFFRFGVEQRVRETGLLEAVGLSAAGVRKLFSVEGLLLAVVGAGLGVAGAVAYCELILHGLRTWWVDAVGTQSIRLDADPAWLVAGAAAGVLAAVLSLVATLRSLRRISPRDRLAGVTAPSVEAAGASRRSRASGVAGALLGLALLALAAAGLIPNVAGFFGSGTLFLIAALFWLRSRLSRQTPAPITGSGPMAVLRLGFRNASYRPGRTVLSVSLIASAIFLVVSVDSFRLGELSDATSPNSPTGGYPLIAESALPLYQNPATEAGRESLGIDGLDGVGLTPFRLRPGDDVSCLNLYRPQDPRILGAPASFLEEGRFRFSKTLASTPETETNPWRLLLEPVIDDAIPAAVAANSMTYILHRKLGDIVEIPVSPERSIRLRLVAALADSVFQRELIISEERFRQAFPAFEGYRVFLVDAPPDSATEITTELEDILADFGFDASSTTERLAAFHQVENTYLSTFQALGALGLVLGTVGLAVILLRNVLERRRELALLRAVGYGSRELALMVLAENVFLLGSGIVIGAVTALLAIAPALAERGGQTSVLSVSTLLLAVLLVGLLSSVAATAAAVRAPLLNALRGE